MADDGQSQAANVLYLAFCDAHGRASDGTPLIAGRSFSAPNGYPALTWGCGPLYHVNPDAPRWLVLSEARVTLETSCPRVFEAAIVYDGPRTDALRYLHDHGAAGMPYLGRRRSGGDHAVLTVGSLGQVRADRHACVAGGEGSSIAASTGAVVAMGRSARAELGQFARVATADQTSVKCQRYGSAVVGMSATLEAGDSALVVAGSMSHCIVGAASVVATEGAGSLKLGARAVGVGRSTTRFCGDDGAVFVVVDAIDDMQPRVLIGRVGMAGIKPHVWYQSNGTTFMEETP